MLNSAEHEVLNAYKYKNVKKSIIFQATSLQVYLDYLRLHVNNKRINNDIHKKIVMALTWCDNTVITYRRKKESRRTTLNLIRLIVVCPL